MKTRSNWTLRWLLLAATACSGTYAFARIAGTQLVINGSIASTRVRVIDGQAYVPIGDVARAFQMVVAQRPGGFELRPAGGANQIQGLTGKIGDVLFDGKWRFQVLGVEVVPSYAASRASDISADYSVYHTLVDRPDDVTFKAKEGLQLVSIHCRVKNGVRNETRELYVYNPYTRTALTDGSGTSYPPVAYDMPGSNFSSKALVPGGAVDFTVLFAVPSGTKPRDLIFTLRTLAGNTKAGSDARVDLTQGSPSQ